MGKMLVVKLIVRILTPNRPFKLKEINIDYGSRINDKRKTIKRVTIP